METLADLSSSDNRPPGRSIVARTLSEQVEISVRRCPMCRAKVLVKLPGEVIIRNAILRVDSPTGRVSAKCARCKTWVEVPLRYTD